MCGNPVSESSEQNVLEEHEVDPNPPNGDQLDMEMFPGDAQSNIENAAVSTLHRVRFCKKIWQNIVKNIFVDKRFKANSHLDKMSLIVTKGSQRVIILEQTYY